MCVCPYVHSQLYTHVEKGIEGLISVRQPTHALKALNKHICTKSTFYTRERDNMFYHSISL